MANPYGYIIAGRGITHPQAWSQTEGYPYKDRSEAKRALAERVRAMGRRGDDVAFDAYLTEPKGRKISKTRIRVPGYAPNPDVRLHWTAQYGHKYDPRQQRSVPDLRQRAAWWRTGLKKPKDVRRAVSKAHKYALKQKDWVKHRVTVEKNPRYFSMIEHFLGVKPEDIPSEGLPWSKVVRRRPKQRKSCSRGRIVRGKGRYSGGKRKSVRNPRRRNRKPAKRRGRWSKRRPRDAKGRFVKIKKRS